MAKKFFDYILAAAGIVVAAPMIGVLILIIRLGSKGPGIFSQDRVGQNGRVFRCYKLRTMSADAIQVPTHMAPASQITAIGAVLRRTKLDELPQLWNILRGQMSFVGPRPCLPSQAELVEERRKLGVLALRPGITGPAQVEGIDMSDPERLARKDAEYLSDISLMTDIRLIWRTVFRGAGRGDRVKNIGS